MSHARLSPSSAYRWMVCPGSIREEAKYPEPPSGKNAVEGTHTHTLISACVAESLREPSTFIGQELEDHEGKFVVDIDQASRAAQLIRYLEKRKKELNDPTIYNEQKVSPGQWIHRQDCKGTADIQIVSTRNRIYEVIDYKDGFNIVKPDNPQNALYALGGLHRYLGDGGLPFDEIRLGICQPRRFGEVQIFEASIEWLNNFANRAWQAACETDKPDASLVAGDHCKYCRAKQNCPEFLKKGMETAGVTFSAVPQVAEQAANKDFSSMSDEELREFIEGIPLLQQTIAAGQAEAMSRFKSGHKVLGLKAVRGPGRRKWRYEEEETAKKLTRMGIPKASVYVRKLVSPAQVEKLTWTNRKGEQGSLSEKQRKTLQKDYVEWTKGELKIVPESADGKEEIITVEGMFESVELPSFLTGVK